MELLLGLLPFLVFLACPLMMVFCMFGMRKSGCSSSSAPAANDVAASVHGLAPAEQIAALQAQVSRLQAEQAIVAQQIAEMAVDADAPATPNTPASPVPAAAPL